MSVGVVTDKTFDQVVLRNEKPVVVYYWAPWCGPCKQQGPIMTRLSEEFVDQIIFVKINTDDNLNTANRNNVKGLPAIHIYRKGELVQVFQGAQGARKLTKALTESS